MSTKARTAKSVSVNLIDYDENIDEIIVTKWDLKSKLNSDFTYNNDFVKSYDNGNDFSLKTLEEEGFSTPILFKNKAGLGLILPTDDFTVDDVAEYVGKNRILDVVDVHTQDAIGMKMSDWCEYYKCSTKTQLLNVISLEYSQSQMDSIVKAPDVILELDWLENCWPQKCRDITIDNKSYLKTLTYPKVRKYCLMSVAGCYTDFHIDLGGTSVWYHIFQGEKIFWIAPPTKLNLEIYEKWCLSSEQASCFFPDLIPDCGKVHLKQGNTFMIPSGWIHGVYTPVDSLVFGGNFLHSLSIPMQLKIWEVEENVKIGPKYRYPFFIEMHWYVLATLVSLYTGKTYIKHSYNKDCESRKMTLNQFEIKGIKYIFQWLRHASMDFTKSIPDNIENPLQLLSDATNVCSSLDTQKFYQNHPEENLSKNEKSVEDQFYYKSSENLDRNPSDSKRLMELEIIPLLNKKIGKVKKREKKTKLRKVKSEIMPSAEIPHQLFDRITQRTGSRQIVRPNRLVENPYSQ